MRYLIYHNSTAFYTFVFIAENNFADGMIVFDLQEHRFTKDGMNWDEIVEDGL